MPRCKNIQEVEKDLLQGFVGRVRKCGAHNRITEGFEFFFLMGPNSYLRRVKRSCDENSCCESFSGVNSATLP